KSVIKTPYPNPASEVINQKVVLAKREVVSIRMYDQLGELVYQHKPGYLASGMNEISIPIHGLNSGMYYMIVETPDARMVHRVMVEQ
ncbi:MAG: T9SS type A sorting domain-containing protein, partial [Cyclobacteriaceae bacterium]|nr:T9SS type A sorting domain-containing protein [Cyclobacteriaceae bacterium]